MTQKLSPEQLEQQHEEYYNKRVKLMLRDFLVDVLNKTNLSKNSNLAEVDKFIESWVKLHFQY